VTGGPPETTEGLLREGIDALHASGSETARLDAELLLGDAVGVGRTVILAHPEAPVGADAAARFRADLARRAAGEPVAYIRGVKEFYGLALAVDRRALIPRPETERLVELGEAEVRGRLPAVQTATQARVRVVDVGTGSGAVIVALAISLRRLGALERVELVATDVSEDALGLARENAVGHAVADVIHFEPADLLAGAAEAGRERPFDVVLANLPYVRRGAVPGLPIAASFEPRLALDGGEDGLQVIGRLLAQLPVALAPDGVALLEIGADQGEGIRERVAATLPGWSCVVEADLAGLPRVARIHPG
jgi:release factor glutamine methyltransferase